jgi:ADP-ribosylglycohydrolase
MWVSGCDLETELRQARDEGRDLSSVEAGFQRLLAVPKPADATWRVILGEQRNEAWLSAAGQLLDQVQTLPYRKDFPYAEPSDLAGIHAARPAGPALKPWRGSRAEFTRRLHGGWLGRICGCMLGKPVEGWHRASIRITSEETGYWPLGNYFRLPTAAEAKRIKKRQPLQDFRNNVWPACMRGAINGMVEDDDTNYTTGGLAIVRQYGANFTPLDVASFWCENLPIFHTCTAERVAYRNFVVGIMPPHSAGHRNPYREWIGAQIRADYFGYANPGNSARAAEWAWRDACISHVKNGIYGEMWVAAMLAAAYVETDWVKIIRAGLAQIPVKSRLSADIEKILAAHAAGASYEAAVNLIHQQWDETQGHHWCHTNSNAQVVAVGLLWGEDDFEKTITRAVMAAFDTDCNGATAGSLWGIKHGVAALPKKWTRPLNDLIRTGVAGYHEVKISQLAADMVEAALKAR